jgi:hypothetical protein
VNSLFNHKDNVGHPVYINTRNGTCEASIRARKEADQLWQIFSSYADNHFHKQFPISPDERYWEMYLGCSLLNRGFKIQSNDYGPDFCFDLGGQKVWVEAVAPSAGEEGKPDRVPDLEFGVAQKSPRDQIIMRYASGFKEKSDKFLSYMKAGLVADDDIKIIALSSSRIRGWGHGDTQPYILSALYPVGRPYVTIDTKTLKTVGQGNEFQPNVTKKNESEISTMPFLSSEFSHISGLIYGEKDIGNPVKFMGCDLVLIHNLRAVVPISTGLIRLNTEYTASESSTEWTIQRHRFPFP